MARQGRMSGRGGAGLFSSIWPARWPVSSDVARIAVLSPISRPCLTDSGPLRPGSHSCLPRNLDPAWKACWEQPRRSSDLSYAIQNQSEAASTAARLRPDPDAGQAGYARMSRMPPVPESGARPETGLRSTTMTASPRRTRPETRPASSTGTTPARDPGPGRRRHRTADPRRRLRLRPRVRRAARPRRHRNRLRLSAKMLELARQRLGPGADLHLADLGSPLPFPDGPFDDVIACLVLHYLQDWTAPLAELRRVLRPGGRLIVAVDHPYAVDLQQRRPGASPTTSRPTTGPNSGPTAPAPPR